MSGNSTPTAGGISLPDIGALPIQNILPTDSNVNPNSVLGQVGTGLATISGNAPKPNLQNPDSLSGTPTQAQANTTALQSQLASESAAATYGTTLTSGAGLLTQPTTTSRVLLGAS